MGNDDDQQGLEKADVADDPACAEVQDDAENRQDRRREHADESAQFLVGAAAEETSPQARCPTRTDGFPDCSSLPNAE